MLKAQGYDIGADGSLLLPEGKKPAMRIPSELVSPLPAVRTTHEYESARGSDLCGRRGDGTGRQSVIIHSLRCHEKQHIVFLELGVGA